MEVEDFLSVREKVSFFPQWLIFMFLSRSSVLFGYTDEGIRRGGIYLENITRPLNRTIAHFHVTPTEIGIKHICVQTHNSET